MDEGLAREGDLIISMIESLPAGLMDNQLAAEVLLGIMDDRVINVFI